MARPKFNPTATQREWVMLAAGAGTPHHEIARALGISRPVLERVFENELYTGAARRRMTVLEHLFRAAKRGHVGAMKEFLRRRPLKRLRPSRPKPDDRVH